jgi:pyrimidine-nucleoside phosphorylase
VNFLRAIEDKRDAGELASDQIREIVCACTAGSVPDYQISAFLMAVFFRGLSARETRDLTLAMRDSGDVLTFPADPRPLVDKHSTGGVGDKVSLPLAPLLACLGFRVPMISGRGLGITGGTLDKLDSIPGFKTSLPVERLTDIVQNVGCVICGQTDRMVPADKKLYALRDVTGTVPSIPLIVASILSKKLAEGLQTLVLDVKFGAAAFMSDQSRAGELGQAMVRLGNDCGVRTSALLTRMDAPLGRAAGNWLEVKEAVACLEPAKPGHEPGGALDDLREIVLACAVQLLVQSGKAKNEADALVEAKSCLASGAPRRKWDEMLEAQGTDLKAFYKRLALDSTAAGIVEIRAPQKGFVTQCDARILGETIRDLGGGRLQKDAVLNYDVGVDQLRKPGEQVTKGETLARVHAASKDTATKAADRLLAAYQILPEPPTDHLLIAEVIR